MFFLLLFISSLARTSYVLTEPKLQSFWNKVFEFEFVFSALRSQIWQGGKQHPVVVRIVRERVQDLCSVFCRPVQPGHRVGRATCEYAHSTCSVFDLLHVSMHAALAQCLTCYMWVCTLHLFSVWQATCEYNYTLHLLSVWPATCEYIHCICTALHLLRVWPATCEYIPCICSVSNLLHVSIYTDFAQCLNCYMWVYTLHLLSVWPATY